MYIRRVSGNKAAGVLLLTILMLPPVAVIIVSMYKGGELWAPAMTAVILAGMGLYVGLRIQLTAYEYEISDGEKAGSYDLTVRSQCGKRIRTECRISLSGKLEPKGYRRQRGESSVRYCPLFCEGEIRLFRPEEAGGNCLIVLSTNDEMLKVMKALGTEE